MAKKLTANQQEYKKQIKRIKAALSKEEKKGYDVSEIRQQIDSAPNRITKKYIESLKDITPKYIRTHSQFTEIPEQEVQDNNDTQYSAYTVDPYHKGGKEYTIYDQDGDIVSKIVPVYEPVQTDADKRELVGYVDISTGELFESTKAVEQNLQADNLEEQITPLVSIPDLTEYAINAIYDQTADLDNAVNNVLHNIFDAVRERTGDQLFYEGLTNGNGFRSAFETLTATLHSGGGYPEAFTKFGAKVIEDLPVTNEEAQELETAFNELIFAAFGADVE